MSHAYYYIHNQDLQLPRFLQVLMLKTYVGTILGSHSADVSPNLCIFQRNWVPFQQMLLLIPLKPTVIHPLFVKI